MVENKEIELIIEGLTTNEGIAIFPVVPHSDTEDDTPELDAEAIRELPIMALRNIVLYPGQVIPVDVGRERSVNLVRSLEQSGGLFGAITQKTKEVEDPLREDLFDVGVVAVIESISDMSNGRLNIMVRGIQRFTLGKITRTEPYLVGAVTLMPEPPAPSMTAEFSVLLHAIKENFVEMFKAQEIKIPRQYIARLQETKNAAFVINLAINTLSAPAEAKQALLELNDITERGLKMLSFQQAEIQMLNLKRSLTSKTQKEMDKQQREYFLQQQIRTFQEELGGASPESEIAELREQGKHKRWSQEVATTFEKELLKAERLNPQSPDYSVQMQYLRTILSLPWGEYTEDNFDLRLAAKKLDEEHYGLEKVKERMLEHLAVLKLNGNMKAPILCLYGPPGVGKTSLGRSIADSLGRRYVRMSLGGVHDEAEIRGHRRTYIGAMCGRILQSLQKAGSSNPVFVLDEIDKVGMSHRGDPSSALLEVLDPEQNTTFHDNYLDIDYDLSKVLFIATANNISSIPQALRDRMEFIEVSGYITEEKVQIAKQHLIPKSAKDHGLADYKVKFAPKAIETIVEQYTRESGVRMLTKHIATIMRKIAWQVASESEVKSDITPKLVKEYLGKPIYSRDKYQGNELPGVVVGLAWTSVGGEILFVETSLHKGTEFKLNLTGSLGDVMKESAHLALGYIRAHRTELGITDEMTREQEIHLHVPEGAVPKDGPSAGITMATSMISAITGRRVRPHLAMTGEITLRGKVLPVGGIKEKILAAKRAGVTDIILCRENQKDILDIKDIYLQGLTFHYVDDIGQVIKLALLPLNA